MSIDTDPNVPKTCIPTDMYKLAYENMPAWIRLLAPIPEHPPSTPPGTYPPWWVKYVVLGIVFMFILWGLKALASNLFG